MEKTLQTLLKAVMINEIRFIPKSNGACFEFYNASTGENIGNLICSNIYKFDINLSFFQKKKNSLALS